MDEQTAALPKLELPPYKNADGTQDAYWIKDHPDHAKRVAEVTGVSMTKPAPIFKGTDHAARAKADAEAKAAFTDALTTSVGLDKQAPGGISEGNFAALMEHIDPMPVEHIVQEYGLDLSNVPPTIRENVDLREAATAQAIMVGVEGMRSDVASEAITLFVSDLVNLRTIQDAEREFRSWAASRRLTEKQIAGAVKIGRALYQKTRQG